MDLEAQLARESLAQLEQRARNADRVIETQAGTPRAAAAEHLLALIFAERARRALPGNIASFLERHPEGFEDSSYLMEERDDKAVASNECRTRLSKAAFDAASTDEDIEGLIDSVVRLVMMTNLIQGSFEKPKLLDAIRTPSNQRAFVAALRELLHGEGEPAERLERFSDYLHTLGLRKWTYGTYFLFLHDPEHCIFVKPEGLKKAVEIAGYPVDYEPTPSARVYRQILAFADWIATQLRAEHNPQLMPKDMIDVQSFVWHMAPTGKFARD